MSQRLQVILDDRELEEIRRVARRHRLTVAEWVRRSLREARRLEPTTASEEKLAAIERATEHDFPVGDVDQLLAEIENGRGDLLPE